MKTEQEVLKMFDEFDEKHGVDRTPNYTVKIGNRYVKSIDYSKEKGWTYETSDEPVWMSKINAESVITDVIEFIDSIPNENKVTFVVKKMKTINEILENYKDYGIPFEDRFGKRFCRFLTPEQMEKIGFSLNDEHKDKHVPKEWTEENVIKQLKEDVLFGWEKACDERGISANLMYEVVKSWCKVLDDDLQYFSDFAPYGKPFFKAIAQKYNIELQDCEEMNELADEMRKEAEK